jgi:TRAP-type C4-dicarboxylate transport system substrate-binding protein
MLSFLQRHRSGICHLLSVAFWVIGGGTALAQSTPSGAVNQNHLRVVGGIATGNRFSKLEEPFWTKELARLTSGKYTAEIVPFDRAGVPGQEMLRMMQLGVIPFGTILLSHIATKYPEFNAPDLAGLNADFDSVRRSAKAFRPYIEKTLLERQNIVVLSVYAYPAQVIFCDRPFKSLTDLKGRRIRVAGVSAADFVEGLEAKPVLTNFSEVMGNMRSRNTECAITAALSGNTLGLPQLTTHLSSMPVNWGLSVFAVNKNSWQALPADLRNTLLQALPKLESEVWNDAAADTLDGLKCNTGDNQCKHGKKGQMSLVDYTAADNKKRIEIFNNTVLPRWLQRCGKSCNAVWQDIIQPASNLK